MLATEFNLLLNKNFINGQWLNGEAAAITVIDPATNNVITTINGVTNVQVQQAIAAAHLAFGAWAKTEAKERARILTQWHNLIVTHLDDLAYILTLEQGKPLREAKAEILYGANFIKWFAEEAKKICGNVVQHNAPNQQIFNIYEPLGVVGAITPWNFPNAMIARKVAPALASGCTVVLKPSELTPLSALALAKLAEIAGLPDGVLNVVVGEAKMIGQQLCTHEDVKKITFTGSTAVGKLLYQQAAPSLKKVALELGGNAPFIVFDDADLELATTELVNNKIRSSGQACIAANRVFVHKAIKAKFLSLLQTKFANLKVGNGLSDTTNLGPLINRQSIDKIHRLINSSVASGAKIIAGGQALANSLLFPPTIIDNCRADMAIFAEEIFGPIVALYDFDNDAELVNLANKTEYGLAVYFYSNNHQRIWQLARLLDYGIIGINEGFISNEFGSFAGRKASGFGIEGSNRGIYEFLQTKYICLKY